MEWPRLKRDCKGLKVRTRTILKNGFMEIPENSVCTIDQAFSYWVSLSGPKCPHCGVCIFIRKVHRTDVELLSL